MDWDQLKYFLFIAKSGSLSRAAKALKVNHSTVSRRLTSLERSLNTRLFEKGINGVKLTAMGEKLLHHTIKIEKHVNAAWQSMEGQEEALCGTIKVSTADIFGYYILPSILNKFMQKHPLVVLDLNISSEFANLSYREADVVITARKNPPEHLVGRNLGLITMCLSASKNYVKKFGKPKSLKELSSHNILCPNDSLGHLTMAKWINKNIPKDRIIFKADKFLSLFNMAKKGLGISPLPRKLVESEIDLIPLFDLPKEFASDAWVLTHPELRDNLTIRTFIQFIGNNLKI